MDRCRPKRSLSTRKPTVSGDNADECDGISVLYGTPRTKPFPEGGASKRAEHGVQSEKRKK
ncbi:hypothetical protein B5F40_09270 [Gordonibacter sp. An230]|nr:hypothetical protein B5F40_09270 [Gordonibacter sp. An230]